jgi:endonuclease-3
MTCTTPEILDLLEAFYGKQEPCWPTDPYHFVVWWNCGYPPSDAACAKGWNSLKEKIGVDPPALLAAPLAKLKKALISGGMIAELRAQRLKEIARLAEEDFAGNLTRSLSEFQPDSRKALKRFPGIADPGADRVLLFGGIAPIPAVPSNCPYVLVRIRNGREHESYGANYREAQETIAREISGSFEERTRAYLLLKRHGQELCKRSKPKCAACPVNESCAYYAAAKE